MNIILFLLAPLTLLMAAGSLAAFWWTFKADQYDDPQGDAARILLGQCRGRARALPDAAHRDIAGGKAIVLGVHRLFGGAACGLKTAFQPFDREARVLRAVAQAIEELRGEGIVFGKRLDLLMRR